MDPTGRDPLPIADYVAAIRRDGARLATAAAQAGPDAAVPSCPEWTVGDLVRHTGGVHRWATGIVGDVRTEPWNVELDEVVGTWPSDDELVGWFGEGVEQLAVTLETADPDVACWSFLRAPTPLTMWARRQAHETAIHRVDAEAANGATGTPFAPAFAADGIDELLALFITRGRRFTSDPARRLRVTATDADGDWDVVVGPAGVVTLPGGSAPADATVTGEASDLYQTLWNRPVDGAIDAGGDRSLVALFLAEVKIRW